jgi:alkanesulfonate monooxygenase SsuD/methylene tetrahydromethanopterin reductase-like flavin-dependent oxidoreductase (luciferase family)
MDHFFQLGEQYGIAHGSIEAPMLEGYTTLGYAAALTQQIRLGLLVTGNPYRHPGVLLKTVSTLDALSGGRVYLGLGAGWFEEEAAGLGIPLPATWRERFDRLEETLQIIRQVWSGDFSPYHGRYYQLTHPINNPRPTVPPSILVGGGGEKRTLRLVAAYADACNFVIGSPRAEFGVLQRSHEDGLALLRRKLDILRGHCDAIGRDFNTIEKTAATYILLKPGGQSTQEVIDICQGYAELGVQHVMLILPNIHEIKPLEILGNQIIPALKDI